MQHMVFMGSEKYPVENAYDSFVSSHGGFCNAFTEGEYTVYQFEVQSEHFAQALDIFAHCFRSPLLSVHAQQREVEAIESEFCLAVNEDASRWQQVFSQHCRPGHPYVKFTWGNLRSLVEEPKQRGLDVQALLQAFRQTHYRPARMKLVLAGPQSLQQLERCVRDSFEDWSLDQIQGSHDDGGSVQHAADVPAPVFSPPLDPIWKQRVNKIVSLEKGQRLLLTWELPPSMRQYRSKSLAYIAHLLGHEGKGSLLSLLRGQMLASRVVAGVGDSNMDCSSYVTLFVVQVQLTRQGLANWPYVVECIGRYLQLLRREGPQRWVFEELRDMAALAFQFQDEEEPADLAERLSVEMLSLLGRERSHLLQASTLHWDFNENEVRQRLEQLALKEARIDLAASSFASMLEADNAGKAEEKKGYAEEGGDSEEESAAEVEEEEDYEGAVADEGDGSEEEENDAADEEDESLSVLLPACEQYEDILNSHCEFTHHVEPHFSVDYWSAPLPEQLYAAWDQRILQRDEEDKVHSSTDPSKQTLHLPPRNPYIPSR
ncbi:hypothetical protein EON64_10060, partial [archaeon]